MREKLNVSATPCKRIAYALGGRPGERLSQGLGLPIHKDALLERVKQMARSRSQAGRIPAIGVDEWAWRKGYGSYGTILVDLERGVVADLLPNRSVGLLRKMAERTSWRGGDQSGP